MKIIFNKKIIAITLVSISVFANANSLSDYINIVTEPSYLLLSLLSCGLIALSRLRQI